MNVIYSIKEHNAVQILSINSLLDEWQNRQILKELQQRIDTGLNRFVIDLTPLAVVNSSGINFLLSLLSKSQKGGGTLTLANASKRIQHLLDITKLSTVFTMTPSVNAAISDLNLDLAA